MSYCLQFHPPGYPEAAFGVCVGIGLSLIVGPLTGVEAESELGVCSVLAVPSGVGLG